MKQQFDKFTISGGSHMKMVRIFLALVLLVSTAVEAKRIRSVRVTAALENKGDTPACITKIEELDADGEVGHVTTFSRDRCIKPGEVMEWPFRLKADETKALRMQYARIGDGSYFCSSVTSPPIRFEGGKSRRRGFSGLDRYGAMNISLSVPP